MKTERFILAEIKLFHNLIFILKFHQSSECIELLFSYIFYFDMKYFIIVSKIFRKYDFIILRRLSFLKDFIFVFNLTIKEY